jgi:NAD(P)-dependent dehydrogenase (short-subunit alcohol dehydrogenase family)
MQETKKIILITGTSSGIGEFLAKKFIDNRNLVIGIARKKATIKNKNYFHYITDISNENTLKKIFYSIKKKFKDIDAVVNNAGSTTEGYKFSSFEINIKDNLNPTFLISKYSVELMKKKGGKIINISSIAGIAALPNNPGYNSSKAAINLLTKSFALDYGKYNINVNSLALGYFPTKMTKKSYADTKKNRLIKKNTILNRWGKLEEIWGPIKFLSSNEANYITGQTLVVDGGWLSKGFK